MQRDRIWPGTAAFDAPADEARKIRSRRRPIPAAGVICRRSVVSVVVPAAPILVVVVTIAYILDLRSGDRIEDEGACVRLAFEIEHALDRTGIPVDGSLPTGGGV